MTKWYCDACGVEMTSMAAVMRTYGAMHYKWLCGACAAFMDAAALRAFEAIRQTTRPRMTARAWLRRFWL